jgi:hypothetical protein
MVCHVCRRDGHTVHVDYCSFTGRRAYPSVRSKNYDQRYGFDVHEECLTDAQRKRLSPRTAAIAASKDGGEVKDPKTGIEELRIAVRLFNNCRESFNERYTLEQLILLYRAYARSDWDITPDEWTDDELAAALAGRGNGVTNL